MSWLNNTVICLAVCCPFGIMRTFGGPDVVAYVATLMALFYVVREIVQARKTKAQVWSVDRVMDCVGPILVCVISWTIGG